MDHAATTDGVVHAVTPLMRQRFGADVSIADARIVAMRERSVTVRCDLAPGPDVPRSVIAKQNTGDDARGFSDWASLAFLSALDGTRGVAPAFYGGDVPARLFVMEDLGGSRTLADLLAAGDSATIRGALRSLAEAMARLVVVTAGPAREARYERLRAELPGALGLGRHAEAARWMAGWSRAAVWFSALDCSVGEACAEDVAQVAQRYAEPGPFLAFSHGDPAPTNNHVGPVSVQLLDFEYGAYRHALYDVTGWYVLCPLPETWMAELYATFRQHLAEDGAMAVDETRYRAAWAAMCAYRALAILSWLPLDIVHADRPWAGEWTMRGALLTAATRLGRATAGTSDLQALSEAGNRLARAARRRWPDLGTGLPWSADSADRERPDSSERRPHGP